MARPHIAGRSIAPLQFLLVVFGETNMLTHCWRRAHIGCSHFLELQLCVVEGVVDDARGEILPPYAVITNVDRDLGRHSELPRFHDDIEEPLVCRILDLCFTAAIGDYLPLLVYDRVQRVHPTIAVGKPHHQLFVSARTLEDGDRLGHRKLAASTNENVAPGAQLT